MLLFRLFLESEDEKYPGTNHRPPAGTHLDLGILLAARWVDHTDRHLDELQPSL